MPVFNLLIEKIFGNDCFPPNRAFVAPLKLCHQAGKPKQ